MRATPSPDRPDEFSTFAVLPRWRAQLVEHALTEAGIESEVTDAFNLGSEGLTDARIQVRNRDLPAAEALIASIEHGPEPR